MRERIEQRNAPRGRIHRRHLAPDSFRLLSLRGQQLDFRRDGFSAVMCPTDSDALARFDVLDALDGGPVENLRAGGIDNVATVPAFVFTTIVVSLAETTVPRVWFLSAWSLVAL